MIDNTVSKYANQLFFKFKTITKNEYQSKFITLILNIGLRKHMDEIRYDYNFKLYRRNKQRI